MNSKQTSAAKTFKCLLVLSISLVLGNTVQASNLANIFTESFSFDNKSFQNPKKEKDGKPLWKVDQMPLFPGGEIAMQKFIMANLTYPVKAQAAREQGRVVVRFVVATDGVIKEVGVIKGLSPECDAEAVRVVEAMPKWTPAKHNGRTVPVYFTIPFMFRLENDENEEIDPDRIIGVETISVSDVREEFIDIQEVPKVKKAGEPFMAVEQMPSFPGGDQAMRKFIKTNLIYPALAQELDVQGRVAVRFVVDVDGTVTNATVLRGIHLLCDREAIRLVNSMPKWNPGKQNGKVVSVYYTIPIVFKLDETKTKKAEPIDTTESVSIAVAEDFDFPDDHKVLVEESPQVGPYTSVEQMPSFPGGEQAMKKFIMTNLRYPVKAQENKIQGRVVTRFVVDKDGAIKDVELLRRVSPECDAEVIRLIKSMPKWNPATNGGRAVPACFTMPFVFRLTNDVTGESTPSDVLLQVHPSLDDSCSQELRAVADVLSMSEDELNGLRIVEDRPQEKPFTSVEQMPSFPGGEMAMQRFIMANLKYPVKAMEAKVQGRVTARFVVDKDGTIKEIELLRRVSPECDAEVLRLIKAMPKWDPGKQNGKDVPVYFTMPFLFRL